MTEADLSRIEDALAIRLPGAHRRRVAPFPIAWEAGNADGPVWDDAGELIALNRRLRAEVEDWPPWLFAVGQAEGDPSGHAIDVRDSDCPVWWLEQMRPGPHSGPTRETFDEWFAQWAVDSSEESSGRPRLAFLVVWVLSSLVGLAACWAWAVHRAARGG